MSIRLVFLFLLFLFSCTNNKRQPSDNNKKHVSACGCQLTDEQELNTCPVKAVDDSVVICKVGTITVLGTDGGTMTWPDYMASKFSGGEGPLVDCETGKALLNGSNSNSLITYKGRYLLVDKRLPFEIYDPASKQWMDQIELPVWRTTISAKDGKLVISPDSLIFRPPFQDKQAFISADSTYKAEMSKTDHYLYMRTTNRLIACALSGDMVSEKRLSSLETDLTDYFTQHPESKKYFEANMAVYTAYKAYLKNGGRQQYFDLSVFPYFYEQLKKRNKNLKQSRTTLKPVTE